MTTPLELWLFSNLFAILHFVLTFAFLSYLLLQKKSPASTIAWFLLALATPWIGILLYIVFGSRKFESRKVVRLQSGDTRNVTDPVQQILLAGGCPAVGSNKYIEFLETGEAAYAQVLKLIDSARASLSLETYIFANDEIGKSILERLTMRAAEGLKVRILLDSFGAHLPGHPSFRKFQRAGGEVCYFMPLIHRPFRGRANLRNHRKLIVADNTVAMVGGMNIASEYMGPVANAKRWVDFAAVVEGRAVPQLQQLFEFDWAFASQSVARPMEAVSEEVQGNPLTNLAQVISSGPDSENDNIHDGLLTAVHTARSRVWIATPYFIPDESLAKSLELAARRGIDVRILMPQKSNHALADAGRGTYVRQIEDAGAKIFLYPHMMHAKVTLIDGRYAFIGSANMDARSLLLNYELGLCLYSPEQILKIEEWYNASLHHAVKDTLMYAGSGRGWKGLREFWGR